MSGPVRPLLSPVHQSPVCWDTHICPVITPDRYKSIYFLFCLCLVYRYRYLCTVCSKAGSLKMNTALEYSTRVVQEGGRRCKKSTLNDLVHLTPLRIPLMNPPVVVRTSILYITGCQSVQQSRLFSYGDV